MRLSTFLLLAFVFAAQAKSFSQSSNLTLDMSKVKLIDVLNEIEEQTDYYFYFNVNLDEYKVKQVKAENQQVKDVLNAILPDLGLGYEIVDRYIVIKKTNEMDHFVMEQQQKSISGKVTDSSGQPLPGVTVVIKGSTQGIITDTSGKYMLNNVSNDAILVFSFVGMKTQEISVAGKETINTILEEETIGIEEVVAVGYGVQNVRDVSTSISSVKAESIENVPISDFRQALAGKMAGVHVMQTSGDPEGTMNIRVRGIKSATAGNDPLYIIDGIPVERGFRKYKQQRY